MDSRSNIVLIGMPGAGKSTVGPLLAQRLSLAYVDTDREIERLEGRSLQQLMDELRVDGFRALEERRVAAFRWTNTVVSTGGSVVYSDAAMRALRLHGIVVWLDVPLDELERRVTDVATRGLVRRPEQGLSELYKERLPLYRAWSDVAVECGMLPPAEVTERVITALSLARA